MVTSKYKYEMRLSSCLEQIAVEPFWAAAYFFSALEGRIQIIIWSFESQVLKSSKNWKHHLFI